MEIIKHFDDYIKENNIESGNLDSTLQKIGYVQFFNNITVRCLGEPTHTHKKYNETSSSLIYVPDATREKLVSGLDIVYVSQLYYGIMANGKMDFNYSNYSDFLVELGSARAQAKKEAFVDADEYSDEFDALSARVYLMKIYMNLIYGMIDKPEAVLTSGLDEPRKYIVDTAKQVMATVVSFYLNKSIPIYYMDTDEIFVKHTFHTMYLEEHFKEKCGDLINTTISNVFCDEEERNFYGVIYGKKKYMLSHSARVVGMPEVKDESLLKQNKNYFGRNFREIFPEYTL